MKNYIVTILFLILSNLIYAQKPSTELVFDCIKSMALQNSIQNEISIYELDKKVIYFWFDNQKKEFSFVTYPNLTIRLSTEAELFDKPVSCYVKIKSVTQLSKKIFFEFQIYGEGNTPCKVKNGIAKLEYLIKN